MKTMAGKEYIILYTHQKTKKAKTWQDGFLRLTEGTRALLYDDKKNKIDSIHIRWECVIPGEQLESDRFLILVEEEKCSPTTSTTSTSSATTCSEKPTPLVKPRAVGLRSGVKRKNTGFMPPRMVKQKCHTDVGQQESEPVPNIMKNDTEDVNMMNVINLYSKKGETFQPYNSTIAVEETQQSLCTSNRKLKTIFYPEINRQSPQTGRGHKDSGNQLEDFIKKVRYTGQDSPKVNTPLSPWSSYGSNNSPLFQQEKGSSSAENSQTDQRGQMTLNHESHLSGQVPNVQEKSSDSQSLGKKRSTLQIMALLKNPKKESLQSYAESNTIDVCSANLNNIEIYSGKKETPSDVEKLGNCKTFRLSVNSNTDILSSMNSPSHLSVKSPVDTKRDSPSHLSVNFPVDTKRDSPSHLSDKKRYSPFHQTINSSPGIMGDSPSHLSVNPNVDTKYESPSYLTIDSGVDTKRDSPSHLPVDFSVDIMRDSPSHLSINSHVDTKNDSPSHLTVDSSVDTMRDTPSHSPVNLNVDTKNDSPSHLTVDSSVVTMRDSPSNLPVNPNVDTKNDSQSHISVNSNVGTKNDLPSHLPVTSSAVIMRDSPSQLLYNSDADTIGTSPSQSQRNSDVHKNCLPSNNDGNSQNSPYLLKADRYDNVQSNPKNINSSEEKDELYSGLEMHSDPEEATFEINFSPLSHVTDSEEENEEECTKQKVPVDDEADCASDSLKEPENINAQDTECDFNSPSISYKGLGDLDFSPDSIRMASFSSQLSFKKHETQTYCEKEQMARSSFLKDSQYDSQEAIFSQQVHMSSESSKPVNTLCQSEQTSQEKELEEQFQEPACHESSQDSYLGSDKEHQPSKLLDHKEILRNDAEIFKTSEDPDCKEISANIVKTFKPSEDSDCKEISGDIFKTFKPSEDSDCKDISENVKTFKTLEDSDCKDISENVKTFKTSEDSDCKDISENVKTFKTSEDSDCKNISGNILKTFKPYEDSDCKDISGNIVIASKPSENLDYKKILGNSTFLHNSKIVGTDDTFKKLSAENGDSNLYIHIPDDLKSPGLRKSTEKKRCYSTDSDNLRSLTLCSLYRDNHNEEAAYNRNSLRGASFHGMTDQVRTTCTELPHPSQLVKQDHLSRAEISHDDNLQRDFVQCANKKLKDYRMKGSVIGGGATREHKRVPPPENLTQNSSQSLSLFKTLENADTSISQFLEDEDSFFVDWNNGKPKFLSNKQKQDSPYQFVPRMEKRSPHLNLSCEVPDIDLQLPGKSKDNVRQQSVHKVESRSDENIFMCRKIGSYDSMNVNNGGNEDCGLDLKTAEVCSSTSSSRSSVDKLSGVRERKAIKSKPFDDPVTHTKYGNCHISPSVHTTSSGMSPQEETRSYIALPSSLSPKPGNKRMSSCKTNDLYYCDSSTNYKDSGNTNFPIDSEFSEANHNAFELSSSSIGSSDLELSFQHNDQRQLPRKQTNETLSFVSKQAPTEIQNPSIAGNKTVIVPSEKHSPSKTDKSSEISKWGKFLYENDSEDMEMILDASFEDKYQAEGLQTSQRSWTQQCQAESMLNGQRSWNKQCKAEGRQANQRSWTQQCQAESLLTGQRSWNKQCQAEGLQANQRSWTQQCQAESLQANQRSWTQQCQAESLLTGQRSWNKQCQAEGLQANQRSWTQQCKAERLQASQWSLTQQRKAESLQANQRSWTQQCQAEGLQASQRSWTQQCQAEGLQAKQDMPEYSPDNLIKEAGEFTVSPEHAYDGDKKTRSVVINQKVPSITETYHRVLDQRSKPFSPNLPTHCAKKFRSPVPSALCSAYTLKISQRNLGGELQFASEEEVNNNSNVTRDIQIPDMFPSAGVYKQVFTAALKEHINIMLFELAKQYHYAVSKLDLTGYEQNTGPEIRKTVSSSPACQCGAASKMVQVKKAGPNQGRFFYACSAARNQQCKFFQWADQSRDKDNKVKSATGKLKLCDSTAINTFMRSQRITYYCGCEFITKSQEDITSHFKKNVPEWVKKKYQMSSGLTKKKMFIRLSKKDQSSLYAKDDLWIISKELDFSRSFLARSTYFGPNANNEVEIEPIASFCPSNWPNHVNCYCILAGNMSSELLYLSNLQENLSPTTMPILPHLLDRTAVHEDTTQNHHFQVPLRPSRDVLTAIHAPMDFVIELVEELIQQYNLNTDQTTALRKLSSMLCQKSDPVLLIHGVFGAGKSFLLSIMVIFLVKLFELNDSYAPGVPHPWKILISSTTNVAVDRILNGLLSVGFEDFVRVGSVKKISKQVLPYSVHATGSDSQELKDLQEMLRSGDLSPSEKHNVRQSIEKHRQGENKKRLGKVRVVGVTCASCSAASLEKMQFSVIFLDECSQMTEPSSLLPIAKFQCQKLVLVGDPKQLDPTVQGSEASHNKGLEQTLFDRLINMGHEPTVLRTQYRCHPKISNLSNTLFYDGKLLDGVLEDDRPVISDQFPTLCFYDVWNGQEQVDDGGSFYNEKEAEFCIVLIEALISQGVDPADIGVITLYKSQMYRIHTALNTRKSDCHKELKSMRVSTVDAFQGGEHNVIILSCVRTRNVGFIDNPKRTNVALTRARHHLFIVGNKQNLAKNKLWSSILQLCAETDNGIQDSEVTRKQLEEANLDTSIGGKGTQESEASSPPMSLTDSVEDDSQKEGLPNKRSRNSRLINADLLESDQSEDEELPNIFNL